MASMEYPDDSETVINGKRWKLKQCEVIYFEDEFGHSYYINEEPVIGVTTILGMGMPVEQGLLEYFKRTDKDAQEDILTDAQERGSNVHGAIEALLLGEKVESKLYRRKREKLGIASFVDFFNKVHPTDVISEHVVAYMNEDVKFAGTLDLIATINGKRILIDFKTSAVHSKKNDLQVQAYKAAVEQSTDEKIDDCYVLYLGTSHKGTRPKADHNGIVNCGVGWNLVYSTGTFQDFGRAYRTALYMNDGKYPTPPKVVTFPDSWRLLEVTGKRGVTKV
ncbi:PD-(D/E)XK nuclease superfamily [uncultured Caudovirales phage]|uniref:PD-(D/E)XK nuclease superfamily n=1 Tax=uncultured Caudovirales phage TaxID=2100421 RepID=A0A6J5LGN0_9CAUD|nr:PD-(D/E)XK nuclease superfamily [uncultured Caudovirales phage]